VSRAADLIHVHRPELLTETGCGPLTAAILIGQTAGAERFRSDAPFARMRASLRYPHPLGDGTAIVFIVAATASSTALCTSSPGSYLRG
jgi:hypothetical protein